MAILALEPNPAQALTIRRVVRDSVRAELILVRTTGELLRALGPAVPELILLPALLPPDDEALLLAHLSTLQNSGYLEMLVTPFVFAKDAPPAISAPRWQFWKRSKQNDRVRPQAHSVEPSAFAEQITWSLRRVQEVRKERAAQPASTALVPAATGADRRAHQRFSADELQGLQGARIKHGPSVRLVDCSAGGALVETEVPLQPDSEAVLELISDGQSSIVPFRVVRCQASVVENRLVYWGACTFAEPLEVAGLMQPRTVEVAASTIDQPDRFDHAIKEIVDPFIVPAESGTDGSPVLRGDQLNRLVASLSDLGRSRPCDHITDVITDLLSIVVAALREGSSCTNAFALVEDCLQLALPGVTARFADAPEPVTAAASDSLYLTVPAAVSAPTRVLNVALPLGVILEDWQFRLLKAGTYLAALLPLAGISTAQPALGRDRRRHVRVPGRFEGRRVGAISLPMVIRDLSETGCFVESLHDEGKGRTLTLEMHFPIEGWTTVKAEVVDNRPGFGFAVRFVEPSNDIRACLVRVVAAHMGTHVKSENADNQTHRRVEPNESLVVTQLKIA